MKNRAENMIRPRRARAFVSAASALTVAALAASCSAGPEVGGDAGATSVDILIPDASPIIVDPAFEVLDEEFSERTGTVVNWVNSGGDYGAVEESILAARIADDLPDAAIISSASIRTYVDSGLAQPFDALMDADTSFDPTTVEESLLGFGEYDGETFGMPLSASWLVMYYNAEVFEAAGLDPENPPQTFSELDAAARQVVESGAAPYGLAFRFTDDPNMWRFQNVTSSGGGALMDGSELTFTDPAIVESVEFLGSLAADGVLAPFHDSSAITQAFRSGEVAITYDASSGARGYAENTNFEYGIAPYPIPNGGSRLLPAGGASIVMFTDDPVRQQAVWTAVRELVGPAGGAAYLETQGGVVVLDKSANESAADAHAELGMSADDIASFRPMFQFPGSSAQEIWSVLSDELEAVVRNGKDPETAMSDAQDAAEALLP